MKKTTLLTILTATAASVLSSCIFGDDDGWGKPRIHGREVIAKKSPPKVSQVQPRQTHNPVAPAPVLPPLPPELTAPAPEQTSNPAVHQKQPDVQQVTEPAPAPQPEVKKKPEIKPQPVAQPAPRAVVRKEESPDPTITQNQPSPAAVKPATAPAAGASPIAAPQPVARPVAPRPRPVMTPTQKERYPVMPGQNRGQKMRENY